MTQTDLAKGLAGSLFVANGLEIREWPEVVLGVLLLAWFTAILVRTRVGQ